VNFFYRAPSKKIIHYIGSIFSSFTKGKNKKKKKERETGEEGGEEREAGGGLA